MEKPENEPLSQVLCPPGVCSSYIAEQSFVSLSHGGGRGGGKVSKEEKKKKNTKNKSTLRVYRDRPLYRDIGPTEPKMFTIRSLQKLWMAAQVGYASSPWLQVLLSGFSGSRF